MNKDTIKKEIEARVMSENHKDYKYWTVGVTDDPGRRKGEHENDGKKVDWWKAWDADSEDDAREIEGHYKDKGMKGGEGGRGNADFVYIF